MTAFCMTLLTWLAWHGVQNGELHILIANGCLWLLGAIFFIYVAGASAEDIIVLVKGVRGGGFSTSQTVISSTQTAEKTL